MRIGSPIQNVIFMILYNELRGTAMSKFIISTCLLMFWVFYEMSGGADFEPLERKIPVAKAPVQATPDIPVVPVVQAAVVTVSQDVTPVKDAKEPMGYTIIPAPEAKIEQVALVTETTPQTDALASAFHTVAGDWVNMRDGPSTDFLVLDTLPRGTEAEVLAVNADGWARIRIVSSGQIGWMAERLLTKG